MLWERLVLVFWFARLAPFALRVYNLHSPLILFVMACALSNLLRALHHNERGRLLACNPSYSVFIWFLLILICLLFVFAQQARKVAENPCTALHGCILPNACFLFVSIGLFRMFAAHLPANHSRAHRVPAFRLWRAVPVDRIFPLHLRTYSYCIALPWNPSWSLRICTSQKGMSSFSGSIEPFLRRIGFYVTLIALLILYSLVGCGRWMFDVGVGSPTLPQDCHPCSCKRPARFRS